MNATAPSRFQIMISLASVGKGFDAYNKARHDCATTLSRLGYQRADLLFPTGRSTVRNRLGFYRNAFRTINRVARACPREVVIQYPLNDRFIPRLLMRYLMHRCRGAHITLLIHDVDSLRERSRLESYEKTFFNRADLLLVHTPAMATYLTDRGVTTPTRLLNLFDYYATEVPAGNSLDSEPDSIVFAGNLLKSPFLASLGPNILRRHLYLYGAVAPGTLPPNSTYQGRFHPDHIADIRGRWGLVWDGNVTDCSQSTLGDYLRFNASHKASLYLAARKPVIVWSQSAIAPFIVNNHLGIAVDSLTEIDNHLDSLTAAELSRIATAVDHQSTLLLSGHHLAAALQS